MLVFSLIWPDKGCPVMKSSLKYYGFFGLMAHLCKAVFLDRKNSRNSIEMMNNAGKIVKREECSILLFPEGTRSDGYKILPFKKGAFHIALTTQYPIQPVVAETFLPFLDHKNFTFKKYSPKVHFLPLIETKGKTVDDIGELIKAAHDSMSKVFDDSVNEWIEASKKLS